MKITGHCIVKNESRFIWYSLMSVINYVDDLLIYDTGSTDQTPKILKTIKTMYPNKINLKFVGEVTVDSYAEVIQQMIDQTTGDWIFVIDADEIWWEDSIKLVRKTIDTNGKSLESIVVPTINLVGDMYHKQEERAGLYELAGRKGHLNLRAVNRAIPGLRSQGPHGKWSWVDEAGTAVQNRDPKKIKYLEAPYLHATFLKRSLEGSDSKVPKRAKKRKHELGIPFPRDFYYPEVFFREKPPFIKDVWENMSTSFYVQSLIETPLRKFKRRFLPTKVGY
jgi:glycosyltransferase involved in cell wall biosynthesis